MPRRRLLTWLVLAASAASGCSPLLSLDGLTGADAAAEDDAGGGDDAAQTGSDSGRNPAESDTGSPEPSDGGSVSDSGGPGQPDGGDSPPADSGSVDVATSPAMDGSGVPPADASQPGMDASVDTGHAAPDVASTPPNFCASLAPAPLFCDDFDVSNLPGSWDSITTTGGNLARDPADSVSSPDSLLATFDALQPGQQLAVAIQKKFPLPNPPTTVNWAYQVKPVSADPTSGNSLVFSSLDFFNAAGDRYSVQLTAASSGGQVHVRLEEESGFTDGGFAYVPHDLPDTLPLGGWTQVQLSVTRTGPTTASAHVAFGNTTEIDTALQMTVDGNELQISIGSFFETEPSGGWELRYDNVTLDVR